MCARLDAQPSPATDGRKTKPGRDIRVRDKETWGRCGTWVRTGLVTPGRTLIVDGEEAQRGFRCVPVED